MKLRWDVKRVTTPDEIESHNNMVETLWRWRHAGLVIETEQNEKLPELINTPKRVIKCECGNDDVSCFSLYSLQDSGRHSLCHYRSDGTINVTYDECDYMRADIGLELGLARKLLPGKNDDGTEYDRVEWLWLLRCDKCDTRKKIWSSELDEFACFN